MISVRYSEIPKCLQVGGFYQALDRDDPHGLIEVPQHCFSQLDVIVSTVEDLALNLYTSRFWGVEGIPQASLEFCFANSVRVWDAVVADITGKDSPEHLALRMAFTRPAYFTMEVTIDCGRPEFIEFWFSKNSPDMESGRDAIPQACKFGRQDLVEKLHEYGYPWDTYACDAAAKYGHLTLLRYLHEHGCSWDDYALVSAAFGGQLACMQYLHAQGCPWDEAVTLECSGQVRYTRVRRKPLHRYIDAVPFPLPPNGHESCLLYALQNNCPIHKECCETAAQFGHLDRLKSLYAYEAHWDEKVTTAAASFGHLNCLQYLHESDCPWDASVPDKAAQNGDLPCLQYALEHGCPYHDNLMELAISANSLACLKYLVEDQGLSMNEKHFETAFLHSHYECMQYLLDFGCPYEGFVFVDAKTRLIKDASFLQCIQCAVQLGWQWNSAFVLFLCTHKDDNSGNVFPLCQAYIASEGWLENEIGNFLFAAHERSKQIVKNMWM